MERKQIYKRVFLLVIITYLFLLSIKLMGSAFKLFGTPLADQLIGLTTNPLVDLFIGILATAFVQSSSVTTSIIVGLVAAGALSVPAAIPMVMGANIGTSVTNTLVSLGHIRNREEFRKAFEVATVHDFFNLIVVLLLFPLELLFHPLEKAASWLTTFLLGTSTTLEFHSPLDYLLSPVATAFKGIFHQNPYALLILSFAMIFFSLHYFTKTIKPLAQTEFKHLLHEHIFQHPWRTFLVGVLLTVMVQSSSVTTSMVVPLAGVGIITLQRIFPYILGANIGTTITALLASLAAGSPAGITIALTHVLFNLFGAAVVYPLKVIPLRLAEFMGRVAMRSRMYAVGYIVAVFYILPALLIFLLH